MALCVDANTAVTAAAVTAVALRIAVYDSRLRQNPGESMGGRMGGSRTLHMQQQRWQQRQQNSQVNRRIVRLSRHLIHKLLV